MDREKVIKHFEHLLNASKGNYQDFVDLTVDAGEEILALLKEQEAVEPFSDDDGGYWCSSCHEDIVWHQKFCSNCGRPVLWEGR